VKRLWIDENTDPDYARIKPWLPPDPPPRNRLCFAHRDPRLSPAYLEAVRGHGYDVELYWASTWDADKSPEQWAAMLNGRWLELGGAERLLSVQVDIEEHDPLRIAAFLAAWRKLRPGLQTSWTMEGFQGGWITAIREQVLAANILLVPQAYAGDMTPYDTDGVVRDLTSRGFPHDRIRVFHDARELRRGWDGYVFTQRRLS
jgi:hypothetical protein